MDKDHTELIEYLDKRFDKIDERINGLETKFDLKFDQLITSIDKMTKALEIYREEQIALSFKVDRMEKWIQQIANKVGIKLEF